MKKLLSTTALATMMIVGAAAFANRASATPMLGIEIIQGASTVSTGPQATDPLILSQSVGNYSVNVEVNTVTLNPLSIDIGSTNISTQTGGTLTVIASVSGLTSPVGMNTLNSILTSHMIFGTGTVSMSAYYSGSDTLFGKDTLIDTIAGPSGTGSGNANLVSPYALTEVLTLTATGAAGFSIDGSTTVPVPEPVSIALLGGALAGLGVIRSRRGKSPV